MLPALLHGKADSSLFKVEDILTSVVFGALQYSLPEAGLVPFLKKSKPFCPENLDDALSEISAVKYEFWPGTWKEALQVSREFDADGAPNTSGEPVTIPGCEPDLLLKIKYHGKQECWLLIEAKLGSSKSSNPTDDFSSIGDQLGKYWLQLKQRASSAGARPLGIVYVTKEMVMPKAELDETQNELSAKGFRSAPLFWLSWRNFAVDEHAPQILVDTSKLLTSRWGLSPIEEMKEWPQAISDRLTQYVFTSTFSWEKCPPDCNLAWKFETKNLEAR